MPPLSGYIEFQFKAKFFLEIKAYVFDDPLPCRSCKTGNCYAFPPALLFHELFYKVPYKEIVYAEIVAPGRKTVGFVDYEPDHISSQKKLFNSYGPERFRGNIKEGGRPIPDPFDGIGPLNGV